MKRKIIFAVLLLGLFALCGCANSQSAELQKQLEELQNANKELNSKLDELQNIVATLETALEVTLTPVPTNVPSPTTTATPSPAPTATPTPDISTNDKLKYYVDYAAAIPAETGARKITETELKELAGLTPRKAAKIISTLADAYEWLKQEGYVTTGACIYGKNYGENWELENSIQGKELSWEEMSTLLNILLEDDYDEVGTLLCVLVPEDRDWAFYYSSFNYVKQDGWYYITDPVCHVSNMGKPFCRTYTVKTNSLKEINTILSDINDVFSPICIVTYPLCTGSIIIQLEENPVSVSFEDVPDLEYIYRAEAEDFVRYEEIKEQIKKEEMAAWKTTAPQIKVDRFGMPSAIGKQTLDYDASVELIGQDPAVIAEKVKTVADVLQYMIAARFGYYSDYFGTPWYGYWGFDAPGDYQISENYGCCCGGYANAVSYLLQGDYEKVGTLRWVGGGNHTISWVYTEGKYYVFDFTRYCSGGNYDFYVYPVTILDRLEDFYDNMPEIYFGYDKSAVVIMVAYESGDTDYPSHWQDPPHFDGLTFPKEAEGKITLIYQKDPNYGVKYREVDVDIPGWNVP